MFGRRSTQSLPFDRSLSYMCMCACMFLCTQVHVQVYVCACGGQRLPSVLFLRSQPTCFSETGAFIFTCSLPIGLNQLASKPQEFICLYLPVLGVREWTIPDFFVCSLNADRSYYPRILFPFLLPSTNPSCSSYQTLFFFQIVYSSVFMLEQNM